MELNHLLRIFSPAHRPPLPRIQISTESWVRTNDLVSMNHTLLPTELSRRGDIVNFHDFTDYDRTRTYNFPLHEGHLTIECT